jgi:acyl carrier protein
MMDKENQAKPKTRAGEIEAMVRAIVAEVLEMDPAEIQGDAHLVEDLGMDSMKALEILAGVEKRFRIRIPEDHLPKMSTLNRIVDLTTQYARA